MSELALFGGPKAVTYVGTGKHDGSDMFKWPIVTQEDENAVLAVLRRGGMSGTDVTKEFEKEYCAWSGSKYALGTCNGTAALLAAMYGCGVGRGDEVICPSITYWASCTAAYSLGATVVFADNDMQTLCLDPRKLEAKITPRTKAIIVVHYLCHPADMDAIMEIANRHGVKVIEDVSHAQGGLYKGRKLGTIGDAAGTSLMAGKSFAIGEAGILQTDNREIYERAIALGTYERYTAADTTTEALKPYCGLPMGGYKHRMHQLSSAMGRVQLKYYDDRCIEIRKAINYFWDLLEGVPGIRAHRVDESTGSNMAGWYEPHGLYVPEELGGLSVTRFCEALMAEGVYAEPGCNAALHSHALFQNCDVFGDGKPTRIANADYDVRKMDTDLQNAEITGAHTYCVPWFKHYWPEVIEQYANAYRKVCTHYKELLPGDPGNPAMIGGYHFFKHTPKTK